MQKKVEVINLIGLEKARKLYEKRQQQQMLVRSICVILVVGFLLGGRL